MSFWDTFKSKAQGGVTLLDQTFVRPVVSVGQSVLHETSTGAHELVHAVEQPIQNIVQDSKVVVGGLYSLSQNVLGLAPYWVGGWLVWTAFGMYFPSEKRALDRSLYGAAKRMRIL